jgi:hypothetical protein
VSDTSCVYRGHVVHKRLAPRQHALRYAVFSLLVDLDRLDALSRRLRLFSRNRFNLLAIHDRDHGAGDGVEIASHIRGVLASHGLAHAGRRIRMLCYPRVLGYVFNPLTVYFCDDAEGSVRAIIYEVSSTFGERRSYVAPVKAVGEKLPLHACAKALFVSPFNVIEGRYTFHVQAPAERVVVGILLRDAQGTPMLKAHFAGERAPLTDAMIARLLLSYPLMTLKVIAGIHLEALRLWLKGVPLVRRPPSRPYSTVLAPPGKEAARP